MGNQGAKDKIQTLERQQEALMKQQADMAQRLAQEQENSRKLHEAHLEQMAKMMLVLMASATTQKATKKERQLIEIDGVQYDITEEINRGGFGVVYKAQAQKSRRLVAIKVMNNSPLIQREIENEIRFLRLTKKLSLNPHPVIEFFGCQVTSDHILIALELAHCDLLTFWFEGLKGRSAEERFTFGTIIIMYTLRALTFLERLNIIHGDIKPQNLVMVQGENSFAIKLIDFGTVEKMHTARALMTVEANKAYTQFFASPEFLKRDSRNLVSRRLHKKSDAWAAGVMFYLLFLAKLPWEDEQDYHNFVNDPRARDIVVPGEGGYKVIIELLLKKNPDQRASAKETLLQMKSHPVLGVIVAALEEAFYPCDDVCKIKIPDDLKEEIANLAPPEKRAQAGSSSDTTSSTGAHGGEPRRACRYGRECYRKNPDHRAAFIHPGDPDYSEARANMKTKCRYGSHCYRKDDAGHAAKYSHP